MMQDYLGLKLRRTQNDCSKFPPFLWACTFGHTEGRRYVNFGGFGRTIEERLM